MIHIRTTIEPEQGDEFQISNISFTRKVLEVNENEEYKYVYGGWFSDKLGDKHYFNNHIWAKRSDNILKIMSQICLDALNHEITE